MVFNFKKQNIFLCWVCSRQIWRQSNESTHKLSYIYRHCKLNHTCILCLYLYFTHLLIVGFASVSLLPFLPLLLQESWVYQEGSSPSGRRESLSFVSPSLIACCQSNIFLTQSVNVIILLLKQCQLNSFNTIA